jgi:uncharacterized membrane protein YfcA
MRGMFGLRTLLLVVLSASGAVFSAYAVAAERRRRAIAPRPPAPPWRPTGKELGIGFLTDFFDTLGIGSFAPTTFLFRTLRVVPDQLIPGTMIIGHMLPSIAEALIYITVIEVDVLTLVLLIAAAGAGSYFGAGLVARLPRRKIQLGMGSALLLASLVMLAGLLDILPAGGDLLALSGPRLVIGLVGNAVLGALMNIGIGAYAPSLIMFGLLGMNVKAIFPIMMGSCAFIMPAGGLQFVKHGSYAPRAALGLTLGGIPGVLLAAFVVRELPLQVLRYFVLAVVVYTAIAMLRAATRRDPLPAGPTPPS